MINTDYDNIEDCINALCGLLNSKNLKEELYKIKEKLSFIRKSYIVMVAKHMNFSRKYNYFDNKREYIKSISTLLYEDELEFITYLEKTKDNKKIEVREEYIPYLKEWIAKVPDLYATFAMKVLAESASEDDKLVVLKAYKDKSAPVRETCARIIGDSCI